MCKEELESGQLDVLYEQDYQAYFIIKETPVRGRQVDYNDEAIREYRHKYAGFFTILTTRKMTAKEALEIYRDKDVVSEVSKKQREILNAFSIDPNTL